jgi:hypothetical protein
VLIADDCKTSRATAMGTQASENHVPAKVCVHHLIEISFFRPWRHLLCSSPSIVRIIFSNADIFNLLQRFWRENKTLGLSFFACLFFLIHACEMREDTPDSQDRGILCLNSVILPLFL